MNALVDQQQKFMFAQPVSQLAESLGLPRFLVDLRHAATHHAHLPSQRVLVHALHSCLRYLHKRYWLVRRRQSQEVAISVESSLTSSSSSSLSPSSSSPALALSLAHSLRPCLELYRDHRQALVEKNRIRRRLQSGEHSDAVDVNMDDDDDNDADTDKFLAELLRIVAEAEAKAKADKNSGNRGSRTGWDNSILAAASTTTPATRSTAVQQPQLQLLKQALLPLLLEPGFLVPLNRRWVRRSRRGWGFQPP